MNRRVSQTLFFFLLCLILLWRFFSRDSFHLVIFARTEHKILKRDCSLFLFGFSVLFQIQWFLELFFLSSPLRLNSTRVFVLFNDKLSDKLGRILLVFFVSSMFYESFFFVFSLCVI